jgi:putative ABC transport system permease protein
MLVSTTAYPPAVLQQIRDEISAVDSNVAIGESGTIATRLDHYYFARPRFLFITLCTFAAIALLLVAVGVFSVVSYTVAMQTHEIGIRMALGAQATQILSLVAKKGLRLIFCGILIGLFASYFLTRFLSSQIWGVSATDPSTFAVIAALSLIVGILACLIPAFRASRADPVIALRYE